MRGLLFALIAILCLGVGKAFAQDNADIGEVHYDPVTQDYFADYPNAKIIVNYYCSDGWSATNRYNFQVVLIDSLLMLGFESPETDEMRYISYQKKTIVSKAFIDSAKNLLGRAGLTQTKKGIPRPGRTAYTQEVLIVKYSTVQIAGGVFFYNMIQEDASQEKINAMIGKERQQTSSIGGNYDDVMRAMKSYFPELNNLMTEALKYKK